MSEQAGITVKIENRQPVELTDLTRCLLAFADEYNRFAGKCDDPFVAHEVKLYIKEIRPGSIIADLVAMAPFALPLMENTSHIVDFVKHLKECLEYLLAKLKNKPQMDRASRENLIQIIEPVAKDSGSQITIGTINIESVHITLNSMEANAAQNFARRELAAMKEPQTGIHEKALLYWFQTRNDTKSTTGDKAVIESVCKNPVKTIFANESIKAKILSASDNPYTRAYVVDVVVETIQDRPALYRITQMHESFSKD